jgi:peptide/nickel transport system permease protein
MLNFLVRRILQMIPTLLGVMLLVFLLFHYFGGDPSEILAGMNASQEQIDSIRKQLGLDLPLWQQMWQFMLKVGTFDWGNSWATNESVAKIFQTRLPATLTVMTPILVIEVLLGTLAGIAVAYVRGSLTDKAVMVICTMAMSISFLVYVIFGQYLFAFVLGWFPVQGWSNSLWTNLSVFTPLPVLLAVIVSLGPHTRLYRSFFLDEINQDYVRTARSKGLSEEAVLFKHVLPNALIPILTNVGTQLPSIFIGSFLIEVFFSIPGLGREVYTAVNRSDYPVIQAATIYLAALTMVINLLTDVLYQWVDPRVKLK